MKEAIQAQVAWVNWTAVLPNKRMTLVLTLQFIQFIPGSCHWDGKQVWLQCQWRRMQAGSAWESQTLCRVKPWEPNPSEDVQQHIWPLNYFITEMFNSEQLRGMKNKEALWKPKRSLWSTEEILALLKPVGILTSIPVRTVSQTQDLAKLALWYRLACSKHRIFSGYCWPWKCSLFCSTWDRTKERVPTQKGSPAPWKLHSASRVFCILETLNANIYVTVPSF